MDTFIHVPSLVDPLSAASLALLSHSPSNFITIAMVDWLSLTVPLAYLGVLLGSLATFSSLYRKRKASASCPSSNNPFLCPRSLTKMVAKTGKATSLEPWFPSHLQRDIYFSLLHLDPPPSSKDGNTKKGTPVPDSVLKAALLRRATEDINRVLALRSQRQALMTLQQRGSVGDDLWQRFQRAESEMEDEVRDVIAEVFSFLLQLFWAGVTRRRFC